MLNLVVQKFQDFNFIRFDRSEDFNKAIKPFLLGSEFGSYISVLPSNYLNFLKMVKKFYGKDVLVSESNSFDSQETMTDFMFTNQSNSRKINEIIHDEDTQDCFPTTSKTAHNTSDSEISTPSRSPSPPPKRVKFQDKTVRITETSDDKYKITFSFDPQVIAAIREIEGKHYSPGEKAWYIPSGSKKEFLKKMAKIGKNIFLH